MKEQEKEVCPKCKGEELDQEYCWDCCGTGFVFTTIEQKKAFLLKTIKEGNYKK